MDFGIMPGGSDPPLEELTKMFNLVHSYTQATAEDLNYFKKERESYVLNYYNYSTLNAQLEQVTNAQTLEAKRRMFQLKEKWDMELNQKAADLIQRLISQANRLEKTVEPLKKLQSRILDLELGHWKRKQRLTGTNAELHEQLNYIQEWCESLVEIIGRNNEIVQQQLKEADWVTSNLLNLCPQGLPETLRNIRGQITKLLQSLVESTFVIVEQPPQVLRTNTKFTSTVRHLVGDKLNIRMNPPQVSVIIINEAQTNALSKNDGTVISQINTLLKAVRTRKRDETNDAILNNTGTMEYRQDTRQLSVSFRNMLLKKIKRGEKKGSESVTDEKSCLLFSSKFSIGHMDFEVWTLSLPVVVIVHGNQEPLASATVMWDNAFSELVREPFAVPDEVPWPRVADALNMKFSAATGRPLSEDNLNFLAGKAFRSDQLNGDYRNQKLSWSQFCKEPLYTSPKGKSFTFWEWFYAVMKVLSSEHLRNPWIDGRILGFVRKKQAEEMLSKCPAGTFLLRFSDSVLGGLTIAGVNKKSEVWMLEPFTSKDFGELSLGDRIKDLRYLHKLYPNIDKETAFNKYCKPSTEEQPTSNRGYIKPKMEMRIPELEEPSVVTPGTDDNGCDNIVNDFQPNIGEEPHLDTEELARLIASLENPSEDLAEILLTESESSSMEY